MTSGGAAPDDLAPVPADTPEISVRTLRGFLLHFEEAYGRERLAALWEREKLPLPLSYVETLSHFVSLRFVESMLDLMVRDSGDPEFATKAGMRIASPGAMGFAYYMLKALATPAVCYERTVELGPTFNRVGTFRIVQMGSDQMVLRYTSRIPEHGRNLCRARMGNFASLPTIWDLAPAEVRETQCHVEGAPCCEYHLRWQALPPVAWRRYVGGLVGVVGGLMAHALALGPAGFSVGAFALTGSALGAWLDTRAELERKDLQLNEQHQGLKRSLEDLQRRNEEIFRTNLELEDRVEARTRELSEANSKLEAALVRQQELDRVKSEFFDNVSHELRTPLTLILLSLESLQKKAPEDLPDVLRQHLATMDRSAQRLLRLINNLLDLAQLESGKVRLRYHPLELYGFLSTLLLPFRTMAEKQGVELVLDGQTVSPVHVDSERIEIVFQNLVSNALKFTQAGRVTVRVREDDADVHVEVVDTGPGIAQRDLAVIFDRFAQADTSGTRRFGGTGIGLALVKETLELHSGGISVTSEVGQGSNFHVRLPKGMAHVRDELRERRRQDVPVRRDRRISGNFPSVATSTPAAAPSSAPHDHPGPDQRAPRVLVVEDDHEIRAFIAGILEQHYRVLEASNGEEGRQRAMTEHPDLVLSDVMMPVMSGLQLLDVLRASPQTVDIPIILLTARQDVSAKVEALGSGANDYLGKPFSPRELLARVETQLRLREAAVRAAENERLAAIGLLTSGFAHEVRNPLNGLMNALVPLKEVVQGGQGTDPDMGVAMLEVMEECGQRIRHLAESLLSFVRTAEKPVAVRLDAALDSTLSVLGWKVPPGVVVERAYHCSEPVLGDPGTLNQVWLNLLDNALRAVGESGRVRVATAREGDEVLVSFSDTGVGIRPEDMERIFQPFFSTRAAGEGTGLGLALSRRIILQHGGRIGVTSKPGEGTRVEVRLPLRPTVGGAPAPTQPSQDRWTRRLG
ncbi:response regulator [Myxococcaceae bacterium JPH2]|nr:response regulator [Myxococcaceae bacterium JPH2]